MAQALVRFMENQYLAYDDKEVRFVRGVFMIPGHGNVLGLGQALTQEAKKLEIYQGKNEQGMAQAAVAFAKHMKRKQIFACTSSIGPGAANMVTACGTATANNIPLLVLPGDTYACRPPDPVLQQVEQTQSLSRDILQEESMASRPPSGTDQCAGGGGCCDQKGKETDADLRRRRPLFRGARGVQAFRREIQYPLRRDAGRQIRRCLDA